MRNSTLGYLEKDGAYLMLHRVKKKHDVNHDKWIGIGGGFEEGESPEDCMRREACEETGLRLGKIAYRGLVTFVCCTEDGMKTEQMHLFTSSDFTGNTDFSGDPCDEGVLEWVPKTEVESLPIWEGDRYFLRLLAADAPFFTMKLGYHGDTLIEARLNDMPYPISGKENAGC